MLAFIVLRHVCYIDSNGKAVHYNGTSLLQWRSVRLDVTLGVGDVAGIGWERSAEQTPGAGSIPKGTVFFTYRGQRLTATLDNVAGAMYPVVQIQKKVSWTGGLGLVVKGGLDWRAWSSCKRWVGLEAWSSCKRWV